MAYSPLLIITFIALSIGFAANTSALLTTFDYWSNSGTYGHSILLVPVCLYLCFKRILQYPSHIADPAFIASIPLALCAVILMVGYLADVVSLQVVAIVSMLPLSLWGLFGHRFFLCLFSTLFILVFTLPVWEVITYPLQMVTAQVSTAVLKLIGIPVFLENHYISIPSGDFDIERACAGLRYLLTSITLGYLYSYLNLITFTARSFMLLLFIMAGIIVNWVRVAIIIYIGHVTEMQHPMIKDHADFGWYLFIPVVVVLFLIGHWLQGKENSHRISEKADSESVTDNGVLTQKNIFVIGFIVSIMISPIVISTYVKQNSKPVPFDLESILSSLTMQSAMPFTHDWKTTFHGADNELYSWYQTDIGDSTGFYMAYYASQTQGKEIINDLNLFFPFPQWKEISNQNIITRSNATLNESVISPDSSHKYLIWNSYYIAGQFVTSPVKGKFLQTWGLLTGRPQALAVAFITEIMSGDVEHSRTSLSQMADSIFPLICQTQKQAEECF